jgi:hypothetical protein
MDWEQAARPALSLSDKMWRYDDVAPPLDPSEATVFAALKIIMEFIAVIARARQTR